MIRLIQIAENIFHTVCDGVEREDAKKAPLFASVNWDKETCVRTSDAGHKYVINLGTGDVEGGNFGAESEEYCKKMNARSTEAKLLHREKYRIEEHLKRYPQTQEKKKLESMLKDTDKKIKEYEKSEQAKAEADKVNAEKEAKRKAEYGDNKHLKLDASVKAYMKDTAENRQKLAEEKTEASIQQRNQQCEQAYESLRGTVGVHQVGANEIVEFESIDGEKVKYSPLGANKFPKKFTSKAGQEEHYKIHCVQNREFGDISMQEMTQQAIDLAGKPVGGNIMGYSIHEAKGAKVVRYDTSSGNMVVMSPNNGIISYFKPVMGKTRAVLADDSTNNEIRVPYLNKGCNEYISMMKAVTNAKHNNELYIK